jgi:hypothetical protein
VERTNRIWELIVAVVALGLGGAAWIASASLPPADDGIAGPALFPRVVGVILIVAAFGLILENLRAAKADTSSDPGEQNIWQNLLKMGVLVVGLALTPFLVGVVGVAPLSVIFTVLACLLLGAKPLESLLTGGVMLAFVYVIFVWLLKVQV